jgi:hypothetical protein
MDMKKSVVALLALAAVAVVGWLAHQVDFVEAIKKMHGE